MKLTEKKLPRWIEGPSCKIKRKRKKEKLQLILIQDNRFLALLVQWWLQTPVERSGCLGYPTGLTGSWRTYWRNKMCPFCSDIPSTFPTFILQRWSWSRRKRMQHAALVASCCISTALRRLRRNSKTTRVCSWRLAAAQLTLTTRLERLDDRPCKRNPHVHVTSEAHKNTHTGQRLTARIRSRRSQLA